MSFDWLSNWNLVRASGFLAYILLSLSIAAGLIRRVPSFQKQKSLFMELHKTSGWTGVLTVVFHATLLLLNHYVPYKIEDLLIPFEADNAPGLSALGTISFYLFFIVMFTSEFFMKKLGHKLWLNIHLLVIPAWVLSVLHGVFIGTDSNEPWAIFIYVIGIVIVVALIIYRYLVQPEDTPKRKPAANASNDTK